MKRRKPRISSFIISKDLCIYSKGKREKKVNKGKDRELNIKTEIEERDLSSNGPFLKWLQWLKSDKFNYSKFKYLNSLYTIFIISTYSAYVYIYKYIICNT